jgi:phosphatidylinositol glycan class B
MPVAVDSGSDLAVNGARVRVHSIQLEPATPSRSILPLFLILALAVFLRLVVFHSAPSIYWADEIFQSQEPAHHIAYGPSVVTWEYRLGVRSWVLPAVLAAVMKLTAWMGSGSTGYVFGIAAFFTLISLTAVWFAFAWCRKSFGIDYAILAAFSTAIWFELINFAPRALNEVLAGNLFLPAIYLGSLTSSKSDTENKWRLTVIGFLLGLTACLRIQYAPAALLVAVWIMSHNWRTRWLPVTVTALAVAAVFGLVDAMTWHIPFYSYWAHFKENIINHRASGFGILPWYYYFGSLFVHTGPLAVFALIGLRRAPILGWISLAVIVPHCFIAHKEFRYIYPVIPILLVLAAIGQIDTLQYFLRKMRWRPQPRVALALASVFVLACSVGFASRFPRWAKARGGLRAFSYLSQDQSACGLAVLDIDWWDTGGYTYLHRPIPLFFLVNPADAATVAESFNRIVQPQSDSLPLPGYVASSCRDGICVYRRQGLCQSGGSEFEINQYLTQVGK